MNFGFADRAALRPVMIGRHALPHPVLFEKATRPIRNTGFGSPGHANSAGVS